MGERHELEVVERPCGHWWCHGPDGREKRVEGVLVMVDIIKSVKEVDKASTVGV